MQSRTSAKNSERHPVSSRLRAIITSRGLTAYALGKAAGVDAGVVQRFLNGERGLSLTSLDKIAAALHLRLDETDDLDREPAGR
jgi:transcriptional regulator with XRE-family HTH domain